MPPEDAQHATNLTANGEPSAAAYEHSRYDGRRRFLRFLLRWIAFTVLVNEGEAQGIENVPASGPAILLINHIAFIDPIYVLHTLPRQIVPLAKIEVYNYPVVGIFPRIWGVIPVRREAIDRTALRKARAVLDSGEIILIAPEGTRSPALQQAKEGIAWLASQSGAPIVPVAVEGTQGFPSLPFLSRWRGPKATARFGQPFRFRPDLERPDRQMLRRMTDEAMSILAAMLPEHRRGVYAGMAGQPTPTIERL